MTEQEKAQRAVILRAEIVELAARYFQCDSELKELNRPALVDAKVILAEMQAREDARRAANKSKVEAPSLPLE